MPDFKPRNDFALIRVTQLGSVGGIAVPDTAVQGKQFTVEAVGPKVEDLMVGDKVLMVGSQQTGDWSFLPNHRDLIIIREANIVLVYGDDNG